MCIKCLNKKCIPAHVLLTPLHLFAELGHVVWPYGSEELDVVVTVIFCHLLGCGFVWSLKHKCVGWKLGLRRQTLL